MNIMSLEITELENKHLVLKWIDIKDSLTNPGLRDLDEIIGIVNNTSQASKGPQEYVVLNLNDELDIDYLIHKLMTHKIKSSTPYVSVKDISVDLVNSVLISGNP